MRVIWRREWRGEWRRLLLWQLVWMAAPVLLYILYYHVNKRMFFHMADALFSLPPEVYAFAGFPHAAEYGNFRIYLYMLVMLLQVCVAWRGCKRMVRAVTANDRNGSIYTLCGQWYSRVQLVLYEYIWVAGTAVAGYVLWYLMIIVLAWKGTVGETARTQVVHFLLGRMGCGVAVLLLLSLAFLYTVYKKDKCQTGTGLAAVLTLGLSALGNLYKIRDLVFWLLERKEIALKQAERLLSWMEGAKALERQAVSSGVLCITPVLERRCYFSACIFLAASRKTPWFI